MGETETQALLKPFLTRYDEATGTTENAVDGLFAIADGLHHVARSIQMLGNGTASTDWGAMEALGKALGDGLENVGSAITGLSDAVRESSGEV